MMMVPLPGAAFTVPVEDAVRGASIGPALPADGSAKEESMLERAPEGIAFPAVLLALASLGATPQRTSAEGPETPAPAVVHRSDAVLAVEAEAASVTEEEAPPLPGPVVGEAVSGSRTDVDDGRVASPGPLDVLDTHPTSVGSVAPVAAAEGSEEAPPASTLEVDEPSGPEPAEAELVLWTMADTVTLDARRLRNLRTDFVARLERVAERMWNEHGLRIEVVEGYRSPERQQRLFAQGRTVDGPVVTWTRNSLHTAGAAADLQADGAPLRPEQAVLLSRVAREEGLRTLHPFDSGHIQLDGVARSEGPEARLPREAPSAQGGPGGRVGVAPVAPVARPARPARPGGLVMSREPARGESAETPAGSAGSSRRSHAAPRGPATGPQGSVVALQSAEQVPSGASPVASAGSSTHVDAEVAEGPKREVHPTEVGSGRERTTGTGGSVTGLGTSGVVPESGRGEGSSFGASSGTPRTPTLEASSYLARLEGPDGTVYRRLHLPIEGLDGAASLRLGVRAGAVDASLTLSDPVLAEDLRQNLHELRQTLATRGIETGGLAIRVVSETGAAADPGGSDDRFAGGRQADARESDQGQGDRRGDPSGSRRRGDQPTPGSRDGRATYAPHDDPTTPGRRDRRTHHRQQEDEHGR